MKKSKKNEGYKRKIMNKRYNQDKKVRKLKKAYRLGKGSEK